MADEDVGLLEVGASGDVSDDTGGSEVLEEEVGQLAEGDATDGADKPEGQEDKPEPGKFGIKEAKEVSAKIKAIDPVAAKAFDRAFWKVQAVDKLGTTQELTAMKEAFELHGGAEGLQSMVEELEGARSLDRGFESGDPKVIDGYIRDFPDGFKKIMPVALDALAKSFPEDYQRVGSSIIHNTFTRANLYDSVARIGEALKAGDAKAAVADYDKLVDLLINVRDSATKTQSDPFADKRKELDTREQELTERGKKEFFSSVRTEVNTSVTRAINTQLATSVLKGRKMEPEARNRLMNDITSALARKVHSDAAFSKQYPGVMASSDRERAVKFNTAAYSKVLPGVVTSVLKDPVWAKYFGSTTPRVAARTNGVSQEQRPVSGVPKIADVDFRRTDQAEFLATKTSHGTAWLRNGKQAKW